MEKKISNEQSIGYMVQRRQILNEDSDFAVKEAYKSLRTNILLYNSDKGCKRFCITSAAAGEGKSITLLNLAISIAESGERVLLIDGDLRRPALARLLVEKPNPGLTDIMTGKENAETAIRKDVFPNLDVLLSGDVISNPSELIGSAKMRNLIAELSEQYDYILVDTPPVGIVTDTCLMEKYLDGVILLVWQGRSRRDAVKKAINSLRLTGAKVLGYIVNGVEVEKKYYNYYY